MRRGCSATLRKFHRIRSSQGFRGLTPCCVTSVCLVRKGCTRTQGITSTCLTLCPRRGCTTRVGHVSNRTTCKRGSCTTTVRSLRHCRRTRRIPTHLTVCGLNVDCFGAKICSGTLSRLNRTANTRSTLTRGTCLRVKLTKLRLGRHGRTHVTFRRTSHVSFSRDVRRRTLFGCTLYVRRASCSPFTRSMAIFRHFLGRCPSSMCTRGIGSCLMRICVGAHDCRITLHSVRGVARPDTHVLRTGRGLLFHVKARLFTRTSCQGTVSCFAHSLRLNRCGRGAGTSTCC